MKMLLVVRYTYICMSFRLAKAISEVERSRAEKNPDLPLNGTLVLPRLDLRQRKQVRLKNLWHELFFHK